MTTEFVSREAHRAHLAAQATLPRGFRVGTAAFAFTPAEAPKPARMTLTLIALDRPTPDFAAVFTRNAFPGAPVLIGRQRLEAPALGAIIANNKISNVCTEGGVEAAERLCDAVATGLAMPRHAVLPSSTGVIGWRLPVDAMLATVPAALAALQTRSALPAAEGIMTTDLYPKLRRADLPGGGSIVGVAKGAGMIEPNLATMLVYVMTDVAVPRARLRSMLARTVDGTFNSISVDSDTSTSDTVVLLSSGAVPCADEDGFELALRQVCRGLAGDVVRNGEGAHHVLRVRVVGAPSDAEARAVGKAVVNSPLVKTAVCGNDPNVGRIVAAIGKHLGASARTVDPAIFALSLGGERIFERGAFRLDPRKEQALVAHLRSAELYASRPSDDGVFRAPVDFPPHERTVDLDVTLGSGPGSADVLGSDLSHEYISENADYRS